MNNQLAIKKNAMLTKIKKKQELKLLKEEHAKENYSNVGYKGKYFNGLHSSELDELEKPVKIPKNYKPQQLTEEPIKKQTKQDKMEERFDAEIDSTLFKDKSVESIGFGKQKADEFLDSLYEGLEE